MKRVLLLLLALLPASAGAAPKPLRVCATTPDLASLARTVGGSHVELTVFTRGAEDAHFVEARPSFVRALHRADVLLLIGLDLEIGWLPVLVNNARNSRVLPGEPGYVDVSRDIEAREIPKGPVDRSMGDVHVRGNPHYLLDPLNAKTAARRIRDVLIRRRPDAREDFERGYNDFSKRIDERLEQWKKLLDPYRGTEVVTDHRVWTYFLHRFGLRTVGTLEPKPGVRPTSRHLAALIQRMREKKVRAILTVPYFDRRYADVVAQKTGARVVDLAHQPGAVPGAKDYLATIDHNVRALAAALKE